MQLNLANIGVADLIELAFGGMCRQPMTDRHLDRMEHVLRIAASYDIEREEILAKTTCDDCGTKLELSTEMTRVIEETKAIQRDILNTIPELRKLESIEQRGAIMERFFMRIFALQTGSEMFEKEAGRLFGRDGVAEFKTMTDGLEKPRDD